jgi:hypothetical protein
MLSFSSRSRSFRNSARRNGSASNKCYGSTWTDIYQTIGGIREGMELFPLRDPIANSGKCNYILQLLSVFSLGFSKTSVLCFYRRVFYVYPRFLVVNNILMVIIVVWAVSFFFTMLFQCHDPCTLWTTFEYDRTSCVDTLSFYYALASTGFITDLMILASPLPIIRQLKMPTETRIAAAFIMLLGALSVKLPHDIPAYR